MSARVRKTSSEATPRPPVELLAAVSRARPCRRADPGRGRRGRRGGRSRSGRGRRSRRRAARSGGLGSFGAVVRRPGRGGREKARGQPPGPFLRRRCRCRGSAGTSCCGLWLARNSALWRSGALSTSSARCAGISPSLMRAVTPSSSPSSSVVRLSSTFSTVVPVKRTVLPVSAGREPMGRSRKAAPVWGPPPSHCPTT